MIKENAILTEPVEKTDSNPKEVTVEDVIEIYPSKNQQWVTSSSEENKNDTPQMASKTEILQHGTKNQDKVTRNMVEKEKSVSHNTKIQPEKPFDLEAKIGKLKIVIPLSELAKHDIYKQKIKKSLQIS